MGKPTGFIEIHRKKHPTRPVAERVRDWREVYLPYPVADLRDQRARCMDCGIPFCHQGCPLGNLIPDWNDLVYRDRWRAATDRAYEENGVTPHPPATRSWKKVAGVGSGPAGLAAADQLNRAGHSVTVFERADRIGGLLRYGIPEFKMEKRFLQRRLEQMEAEGTEFRTGVNVGVDVTAEQLRREFDAIVLAGGATAA